MTKLTVTFCNFAKAPKDKKKSYNKLQVENSLLLGIRKRVGAGQRSRYSDWLRAERSGDRIPMGKRFSAPVQTGPGAHLASYTMGTGSFPGVKRTGRGIDHNPI